jgi:hypothetical protein
VTLIWACISHALSFQYILYIYILLFKGVLLSSAQHPSLDALQCIPSISLINLMYIFWFKLECNNYKTEWWSHLYIYTDIYVLLCYILDVYLSFCLFALVYILLFCLTCRTLHVDINRGVTEFDTHLSLYLSCIVVSIYIHYIYKRLTK